MELIRREIHEEIITIRNSNLQEITSETFQGFTNLKKLIITDNSELKKIKQRSFIGLKDLRSIELNNNKIQNIYSYAFCGADDQIADRLDYHNHFDYCHPDFRDCDCDFMRPDDLNHLYRLRKLQLNNNKIETIEQFGFTDLYSLRELYLERNEIKELQKNIFKGLRNLEILKLNNNKLRVLKDRTFEGLSKLKELYLERNETEIIENLAFFGIQNLRILKLNDNKFNSNLNNKLSYIFKDLINLRELYLERNEIKFIYGIINIFHFQNIEKLNLNGNKIDAINPKMFKDLGNLSELYLANNMIFLIHEKAFFGSNRIEILDLTCNIIQDVNSAFELGFSRLN